jgi:hypothetical protein
MWSFSFSSNRIPERRHSASLQRSGVPILGGWPRGERRSADARLNPSVGFLEQSVLFGGGRAENVRDTR